MNPFEPENCADHRHETSDWHRSRLDLWIAFCQKFRVAEDSLPLFDCDDAGFVRTKEIAKPRPRKFLRRSEAMETSMCRESRKVGDHKNATAQYNGIIYIMHTGSPDGVVVPRYIGKSEQSARPLEFCPSISRVLKQINQSSVAGVTICLPRRRLEFSRSSGPRNRSSATKISTLGTSAL